jgi:hypothetical protein
MIRRLFVIPLLVTVALSAGVWLVAVTVIGFTVGYDAAMPGANVFGAFAYLFIMAWKITEADRRENIEPEVELEEPPSAEPEDWLKVENRSIDGKTLYFGYVPIDEWQLRSLAYKLLHENIGKSFAMRRSEGWARSREHYIQIREGLLKAHVIEWINPQNHLSGMRLTPDGRAWCKALVGSNPPPPLKDIDQMLYQDARTQET